MDSVLDFLFLRRLKFEYISPPVCPFPIASATGQSLGQFIIPLMQMPPLTVINGGFLAWSCYPEGVCYNIYHFDNGQYILVTQCVPENTLTVCTAATWTVNPVVDGVEVPDKGITMVATGVEPLTIPLPNIAGATSFIVYKDGVLDFQGSFCTAVETCLPGCFAVSAVTPDGESPLSPVACTGELPTIRITSPENGQTFYSCSPSVPVVAEVVANNNTINYVEFFVGPTPIGSAFSAPYSVVWNGSPGDSPTFVAILHYNADQVLASDSVTISTAQFTPKTVDWANRVIANGYPIPSIATRCAVDTWYQGVVAAGLDSKILANVFFVDDSWGAAVTPYFNTVGDADWTGAAPAPGQLGPNGLALNSGVVLHTGVVPDAAFTFGHAGMTMYAYDAGHNALTFEDTCGSTDDNTFANAFMILNEQGGTAYFETDGVAGQIAVATTGFNGWLSGQQIPPGNNDLYFANSTNPHSSLGHVGAGGGFNMTSVWIGTVHIGNFANAQLSSATLSFFMFTSGLTEAEDATMYNLTQTLRQTLGGGFR